MQTRVHLKIHGRVQGVCFRYYCVDMAEQYGIRGFVRNNYDGSVEVVAEGEDEAIKQFVTWCRRGPPAAVVHSCEENREDPTGEFKSFSLRH